LKSVVGACQVQKVYDSQDKKASFGNGVGDIETLPLSMTGSDLLICMTC
jgi:hypothetical protein